jgi:hypothetical protein
LKESYCVIFHRFLLKFLTISCLIYQSLATVTLYCYYNNHYFGYIGQSYVRSPYTCDGVVDVINDGSRDLDMVYGSHITGQSLGSVEFLNIADDNLNSIPPNLALFFPNLRGILIRKSNLIFLSSDDLKNFYNLTI